MTAPTMGLVAFVKHYREIIRENVRLKQQLLLQFQSSKKQLKEQQHGKKKRKKKGFRAHSQGLVGGAAGPAGQWRNEGLRTQTFFNTEKALASHTHHAPAESLRKMWVRVFGATGARLVAASDPLASHAGAPRASDAGSLAAGAPSTAATATKKRDLGFHSPFAGSDYDGMTSFNPTVRYYLIKAVGRFCQFWSTSLMKSCDIRGKEIMHEAILNRREGQALITVSNHVAAIDDPFVTSLLVPDEALEKAERPRAAAMPRNAHASSSSSSASDSQPGALEPSGGEGNKSPAAAADDAVYGNKVRWVMCATDRCFKTRLESAFFKAVQALPVQRGAGLGQPSMEVATQLLSRGGWVHIFPEGTRSRTGDLLRMKPGVGQLVVNTLDELKKNRELSSSPSSSSSLPSSLAEMSPVIVPYYHEGMGEMMQKGKKLPRMGTDMRVVVGEPIEIKDLVSAFAAGRLGERDLRNRVLERVETAIHQLKRKSHEEDFRVTYNDKYAVGMADQARYEDPSGPEAGADPMGAIAWEGVSMWNKLEPLAARAAAFTGEIAESESETEMETDGPYAVLGGAEGRLSLSWALKKALAPLELNLASVGDQRSSPLQLI